MSDNPESNCAEIVIKEIRKSMEKVSNVELVDKEARPLLFNDYSTADTIIKLKPSNQLIFAHSSIISKSPFFEACKNFKESNGYIEITPPSESTTSTLLCIEFLYSYDSDLVNATSDIDHHVKSIIQSKFFADVFITAMYLQIDHLLKLCYESFSGSWKFAIENPIFNMKNIPIECLYIMIKDYGTKIKAMDKMLIILIWADGFISDQKFVKQVQKLVIESVPASEFDYQVLHQLSVTFHSSFGLFFPVSFVIEKFANIEKEFLVYKETSDQVKEKLKVHVSKLAVSLVPCGLNTKQFHVTIPILINKWLDEFMVE